MAVRKKANPKSATCSHETDAQNYSTIVPNQHLKPINGKIYWHIVEETLTNDIEKYKVIYAFEQAFKSWQPSLTPIIFEATGNKDIAQIRIFFLRNGDNRLPVPFSDGVLAYAYAPNDESLGVHADMYFNDAYRWDEIHKPGSIFLFKVAVHELGHTLNIGHQTADKTDIMYPIYQPDNSVIINKDTQKGIYDLYKAYGVKNPNATPQGNSGKTLSLKELFKSKGDVARLTPTQLDVLNIFLSAGFIKTDKPQVKINKIWEAIQAT